jgi:N-hydroxyarylamine O-acetyltransferase
MDLEAYFERVGDTGDRSATLATLQRLQRAHATTIPFENLDIHLGRGVKIDIDSVEAKLVTAKRGGYCFEQNLLFATVLDALGFDVARLGARVRIGGSTTGARTHMLLAVAIDGERWMADVGFGGAGSLGPIEIVDGSTASHGVWTHRIVRSGSEWVLQLEQPKGWLDLYAFTDEPQLPADYEVANHYTATHPTSGFVLGITAQFPGTEMQLVLRGDQLGEYRPDGVTSTTVKDDELLAVLRDRFTLHFPAGTKFRSPNGLG